MDRRPHPDDTTLTGRPPGNVRRDAQGNAVWQWAANTGRQALDSTSRLLRKLDVPGLKLLDEEESSKGAAGADASKGYDPYGGRGSAVAARAARPAPKAAPARVAPAKAKPSLLSRLLGRR